MTIAPGLALTPADLLRTTIAAEHAATQLDGAADFHASSLSCGAMDALAVLFASVGRTDVAGEWLTVHCAHAHEPGTTGHGAINAAAWTDGFDADRLVNEYLTALTRKD